VLSTLVRGARATGCTGVVSARAQCLLCVRWLATVDSRHLRRVHGITLDEYYDTVARTRAARADRRLPDGTPYYGQLGEIAYDADEDLVQCHLCGSWLKWVGGMHLRSRHDGWTIAEYRRAFGLRNSQVTMAASSRGRLRKLALERLEEGRLGSPLGGAHGLQTRPWRSFAERCPELVAELHPTRNGDLDVSALGVWSSERVWWRCSQCATEWRATITDRAARGGGCPACGPRAAVRRGRPDKPFEQRPLAAVRPDLVAELHPTRNPDLNAGEIGVWAKRKVWWRCPECNHEWQALIMNRHQGTGCPRCAAERRIATYQHNQTEAGSGSV
jgi:ssDNA-binding Zn-finger/Zn-ribbon topoisomerase 1